MSGKTEAATPRRLKRAREAGDVPLSGALVRAAALGVGVVLSASLVDRARERLPELLRDAYRAPESRGFLERAGLEFFQVILPWLGAVALAAATVTFAQTGAAVRLRFGSDPSARPYGRIFEGQRWIAASIGCCTALFVGFIALALLYRYPQSLANSVSHPRALGALLEFFLLHLLGWAAGAALLVGLVDLWIARRLWRERLRMTRAELRAELRESGNDPELKAWRARFGHELLAANPTELVASATLIVHDGAQIAILLGYDRDSERAPVVLAIARDQVAMNVLASARSLGIPLASAPLLARSLARAEPGALIPEDSYQAVADLLRPIVNCQAD